MRLALTPDGYSTLRLSSAAPSTRIYPMVILRRARRTLTKKLPVSSQSTYWLLVMRPCSLPWVILESLSTEGGFTITRLGPRLYLLSLPPQSSVTLGNVLGMWQTSDS